ncbi:MAG: ATP-binding cassette domain-containing protein [Oscillospiraceae bacterium]
MTTIKTIGLTKKYKDVTAVDSLEMEIADGELFSLLGVNGAGKTTTIRMLSCLTRPTSGDAFLLGHSVLNDTRRVKEIINVSPQETAVAPNLSVRENLELICGIYGHDRNESRRKSQEFIGKFGMEQIASKHAGKLSGG